MDGCFDDNNDDDDDDDDDDDEKFDEERPLTADNVEKQTHFVL